MAFICSSLNLGPQTEVSFNERKVFCMTESFVKGVVLGPLLLAPVPQTRESSKVNSLVLLDPSKSELDERDLKSKG